MENKNEFTLKKALNRISIGYNNNVPKTVLQSPKYKQKQHSQRVSFRFNKSPSQIQRSQSVEKEFNDLNLKCGDSQLLKSQKFNRMRIHIYKKERKPKWKQIPESGQKIQKNVQSIINKRELNELYQINRTNQTAQTKRDSLDYHYNSSKIKTRTQQNHYQIISQNKKDDQEQRQKEYSNLFTIKFIKNLMKFRAYNEQSRLSAKLSGQPRKQSILTRKRYKNLSDSISSSIAKTKFQVKQMKSPPRLTIDEQNQKQIITRDQSPDKQHFQAWQDLLSTNRNGIVEYLNENSPETKNDENNIQEEIVIKNTTQIKKKRRFLIKEKKQNRKIQNTQ